jgi:hypothetical protein
MLLQPRPQGIFVLSPVLKARLSLALFSKYRYLSRATMLTRYGTIIRSRVLVLDLTAALSRIFSLDSRASERNAKRKQIFSLAYFESK